MGEGLLAETLQCNAADGNDVGAHERGGGEREHGVEGDGRTNVDERDSHGEETGEDDGIDGNVPFWVDLGEPWGEWKTVITGEGECLARG